MPPRTKAALSSSKTTFMSSRMKTSLSPCTKTSLPLVILPVILLYNSAKLQYFLQYLAVDFQDCRITLRTQALTLFSLKLLRGCVRMGTSHTFTIKHISGYGRGIVYSTFPLRSLLIIYRGNVRFKRSSYISQNG